MTTPPETPRPPSSPHQAPRRISPRSTPDWHLLSGVIHVGATTPFDNPFRCGDPNHLGWGDVRDSDHAVWLYQQWLVTPSRSIVYELDRHDEILRRLPSLTGHHLCCGCRLGVPCHADVLLLLAARPDIASVTGLLLDCTLPMMAIERTIAVGQLASATGMTPGDAARLGSSMTALADQVRAARAARAPARSEDT
ncbi:MAG: DUF4326 domain-containing protein [Bacteroidales bacterium]|nr:DUF4326 domain-containing protein [Bacteroidales bacterium]